MGGGGACTEALAPERVMTMSRMTARTAPDAHTMCFGFRTESIFICYFSCSWNMGLRELSFSATAHWGIDWLICCDLLAEPFQPHTLHDQACSGLIHGRQKLAPVVVDTCQLPHVDFDLFP